MKAYLDSSILLRVLLREPRPLRSFKRIKFAVSSELLRVECFRVIDRLRLEARLADAEVAALQQELHQVCASVEFVRVTPLLLGMASQPFPTTVRTLDAIHLASAMLWTQGREEQVVFLTHDAQLGTAARALGFEVEGA